MKADILTSRLTKCRETSRGNWVACCPAHQDKNPSMTIRETDDGRVLLHCFAGCSVEEILGALGIGFDALFPEKPQQARPLRRPFNAHDVLAALETEAMIVSFGALDIGKGKILSDVERQRLLLASRRVREGVELANG